jgi:hypothetical protein
MAARGASARKTEAPAAIVGADPATLKRAAAKLGDRLWRLDNLYTVKLESGEVIPFKLNDEQREFVTQAHGFNIILKARQLGFTTLVCILMLDACLFNSNTACGIIADTRENASKIFVEKIKDVYARLPDWLKRERPTKTDRANELKFSNNSVIWTGTSHRGGTLQWLHISEYGKICAKWPHKAKEIRTGALNTIHAGQTIIVESTAEGQDGHFFDMTQRAKAKLDLGTTLTPLDFKLHFFPWWRKASYAIDPTGVIITPDVAQYFETLRVKHGIELTDGQKAWYVKKLEDQEEEMAREYPSTPDEPFFTAIEGGYYTRELAKAREDKRICRVLHETALPVHTMWDLGLDDEMACWFLQVHGRELRFIRYMEWHDTGLAECISDIQKLGYVWGKMAMPHDIEVRELIGAEKRKTFLENAGFDVIVAPAGAGSLAEGISQVRMLFSRMLFDEEHCALGLKRLTNYRKQWDHIRGVWLPRPLHDINSNGADALRTGAAVMDDLAPKTTKAFSYGQTAGGFWGT